MKIAIIGASGFVGRHLHTHLEGAGHRCYASDVYVPLDLGSRVSICDLTREGPNFPRGLDAAVYLAQFPGYRDFPEHAGDLFAVNAAGALRAAEAARRAGAKAFVFASTGTVYAPSFGPMSEDDPVRRDQAYALSKVQAEEALALFDRPATCSVRLFGVFGEDQTTMLVPALAGRIARGDPITIEPNPHDPDDEDGLRIALTHVADVCTVIRLLIERITSGQDTPAVVNVANPEAVSIRALAHAIAGRLGSEPVFATAPQSRPSDYIADISKLRSMIDHEFLPLDAAMERTFPAHA
jgi:nucleoside-diphosphate-sugar epimerase